MTNPFDQLAYHNLDGLSDKLKKLKNKAKAVANKAKAVLDASPMGKIKQKVDAKVMATSWGKKIAPALVLAAGGPVALAQFKDEQKIGVKIAKSEAQYAAEEAAFWASPEGIAYKQERADLDAALSEIRNSPEYKAIYDDLKSQGYSDDEIAYNFMTSKPARDAAKNATVQVAHEMALQEAQVMMPTAPPEMIDAVASAAAMDIADREVDNAATAITGQPVGTAKPKALLPLAIGVASLFLLGG